MSGKHKYNRVCQLVITAVNLSLSNTWCGGKLDDDGDDGTSTNNRKKCLFWNDIKSLGWLMRVFWENITNESWCFTPKKKSWWNLKNYMKHLLFYIFVHICIFDSKHNCNNFKVFWDTFCFFFLLKIRSEIWVYAHLKMLVPNFHYFIIHLTSKHFYFTLYFFLARKNVCNQFKISAKNLNFPLKPQ